MSFERRTYPQKLKYIKSNRKERKEVFIEKRHIFRTQRRLHLAKNFLIVVLFYKKPIAAPLAEF